MSEKVVTIKVDDEKVNFDDFVDELHEFLEDDIADGIAKVEVVD
jgi:hypothetical protein